MLKNMSTKGLQAKWGYLNNCSPLKTQARTLARTIEKELIRRGVLVEDDDESTLTEGSWGE
jgi:predicted nuclease of restriction endonuclease-like (RecB) superfamily